MKEKSQPLDILQAKGHLKMEILCHNSKFTKT